MSGLAALIVSVAALDSLNPSTVGPALVLAAVAPHSGRQVAAFAAGVFVVSTLGGIVLLVGPGHALLARLARPSARAEHLAGVVCGIVLLGVAIVLWAKRSRPRAARMRFGSRSGRSAFLLGGGIMAVELPTAIPYVAGLVAIVEARRSLLERLLLVLLYNAVFVLPLALLVVLAFLAGPEADVRMLHLRLRIERRAPTVVPLIVGAAGVVLLAFGAGAF